AKAYRKYLLTLQRMYGIIGGEMAFAYCCCVLYRRKILLPPEAFSSFSGRRYTASLIAAQVCAILTISTVVYNISLKIGSVQVLSSI
ncbi:hypothetical protein PMAYCL1PPCAC_20689, partial [Pristionchus mayeri]